MIIIYIPKNKTDYEVQSGKVVSKGYFFIDCYGRDNHTVNVMMRVLINKLKDDASLKVHKNVMIYIIATDLLQAKRIQAKVKATATTKIIQQCEKCLQETNKATSLRENFENQYNWFKEYEDAMNALNLSNFEERQAWQKIEKQFILKSNDLPGSDKYSDLSKQFISDYINEKRFIISKHSFKVTEYTKSEIWNESMSFYSAILRKSAKDEIGKKVFSKLSGFKSHESLVDVLKQVGDHAKRFGSVFSKNWMDFVNLEMLWKFGSIYNESELIEDIYSWFKPKEINFEDVFYRHFQKAIDDIFNEYWSDYKTDTRFIKLNLKDYLRSGKWGTTGATSMKTFAYRDLNGKQVKSSKSKNSSMLFQDPDKIYDLIMNQQNPQVDKLSIKPDEAPNKTRVIAALDNINYIMQSYLDQFIMQRMSSRLSTLFKNNEQLTKVFVNMLERVTTVNTYKVPIDQRKFDHHVTRRMLQIYYDKIMSVTEDGSEERLVASKMIENMFSKKAKWVFTYTSMEEAEKIVRKYTDIKLNTKNKTVEGTVEGGVPSGIRWTGETDTIISIAEEYAIERTVEELFGVNIKSTNKEFQGDDITLEVEKKDMAVALVAGYSILGFEVNKGKFFVATDRNEFLRRVAIKDIGVVGYLARGVHSLLWKPSSKQAREKQNIQEICDSWLTLIRRGAKQSVVLHAMISELRSLFKLSKESIINWLATPVSYGGYGLLDESQAKTFVRLDRKETKNSEKVSQNLMGLKAFAKVVGIEMTDKEVDELANSMAPPVKVDRIVKSDYVVSEVQVVNPIYPVSMKQCSVAPRWKNGFPTLMVQTLIQRAKTRNDFRVLFKDTMELQSYDDLLHLLNNASLRVVKDWLMNSFDICVKRLSNVSYEIYKGIHADMIYIIRSALGMHKVTTMAMNKAKYYIECYSKLGYRLRKISSKVGIPVHTIRLTN